MHEASILDKNDRYQALRKTLDERIICNYKLWKTNFIAYDMLEGKGKYSDRYSKENVEEFESYMAHKLGKVERCLNHDELKQIFLDIYANPVRAKEELLNGKVDV